MDLRFSAFELIASDDVLRKLLVNYADRLDGGDCCRSETRQPCYLALQWADRDGSAAPAGPQSLTARVHLPRDRADEQSYLDVVLRRLEAALTRGAASGFLTVRRVSPCHPSAEHGADTIFKTMTFEVAAPCLRVGPDGRADHHAGSVFSNGRADGGS
jgi:hypothetical protein